jgi:hypothetical protein
MVNTPAAGYVVSMAGPSWRGDQFPLHADVLFLELTMKISGRGPGSSQKRRSGLRR